MTAATTGPTRAELVGALDVAVRAPSIHNTQPWRWRLREDGMELHADPDRQLPGTDPDGHSLTLSCGAALELARLGLAAQGWGAQVGRMPDVADPDLLARIQVTDREEVREDVLARADAAKRRVVDRRPFDPRPVAPDLLRRLASAGEGPGVSLHVIRLEEELLRLTVFTSQLTRLEEGDEPVRGDLAAWTHEDDEDEGIPSRVIPSESHRRSDLEMRDFGLVVHGTQEIDASEDEHPAVMVVFSETDDPVGWLQAGEAVARVLVDAEVVGLSAVPFTQPVDWPWARARLREMMGWVAHPQFLIRVGWPPPGERPRPVGRRAAEAVIDES